MLDVTTLVLASDDGGGVGWLLALGPVGAASFYWGVWRAYRNTDKSHSYERETEVVVSNMTGDDVKVGTNNGTQERHIRGRNSDNPRQRL
ncbi:hypothetical protein [Protaetiibacter intestinalis]|uniref:Uncharacterized protein n=1 Tax=Protaetiibacter intestinalis TaxID=2419774 RepID=A0A387B3T4_9MICO|nr:hypothetical protein [Protaetiibacter intestinalis]AYF98232.1 hypothetical protein D7I47_08175 [Protaetiibacter intestinalis]